MCNNYDISSCLVLLFSPSSILLGSFLVPGETHWNVFNRLLEPECQYWAKAQQEIKRRYTLFVLSLLSALYLILWSKHLSFGIIFDKAIFLTLWPISVPLPKFISKKSLNPRLSCRLLWIQLLSFCLSLSVKLFCEDWLVKV